MVVAGREEEYLRLERYLDMFLRTGGGGIVYVSGVPGSGKTHTVRRLLEKRGVPHLFLNATRLRSRREVYRWILTGLPCGSDPKRMYAVALRRHFTECTEQHVVVIDEVDILAGRGQEVLYNVFEMPYLEKSKLLLLLVSNTMDLPERLLEPKICSRIGKRRVNFVPYTSGQLCAIAEGGDLDRRCVELISKRVGAVSGDVRRVRDVVSRVREEGRGNEAGLLDVDSIMKGMYAPLYTSYLQGLSLYQKAAVAVLSGSEKDGVRIGELYDELVSLCRRAGIEEIGFFEFEGIVDGLASYGIFRRRNSGREVSMMVLKEEVERALGTDREYLKVVRRMGVKR